MKVRALSLFAAVALSTLATQAFSADLGLRGGYSPRIKDASDIPAPIPVPAANPVGEGFSYYLRVDGGWSTTAGQPSFSEVGRTYGSPVTFSSLRTETPDIGFGGIGFGAYLTPMLRGDVTLELRSSRDTNTIGAYSYGAQNGALQDNFHVQSSVALVNGYVDLLPRGRFSPYVGAGVGVAYHQINRTYVARETGGTTQTISGDSTAQRTGLAAAGMAGVTYAFDHRWAVDVNYRALYMQGVSASTTLSNSQVSKAELADSWEHQVRIGLRFNIW
jgi:opacity protein-like surface antigen